MAPVLPALTALLLLLSTTALEAQTCDKQQWGHTQPCVQPSESRTAGELLTLGANMAIGGLTAGIRQWRSDDGSFWNGLWRGALGGAGTYAGKRIVTSDMPGAGLLGRGVAATGASVTRNASEGDPLFDTLVLPVGFVRLHWRPAHGTVQSSFDIPGIAAIAGVYASGLGASLDVARSLDTGAPVFMARDWEHDDGWHGRHIFGAVLLRGDPGDRAGHDALLTRALHHERIHVLQYDQTFILWNEPVEKALLTSLGSPSWVVRSVDLSLYAAALAGVKRFLPRNYQVWEIEADFLARTAGDRFSF
jgi:hypothetical protein